MTPDPERTARYDAFHEHYRALYPATADAAHFLAEEQRRARAAASRPGAR